MLLKVRAEGMKPPSLTDRYGDSRAQWLPWLTCSGLGGPSKRSLRWYDSGSWSLGSSPAPPDLTEWCQIASVVAPSPILFPRFRFTCAESERVTEGARTRALL